ncbi:MAG: hypothetical protein KAG99_03895 [Bacteroidales bacterium]|nr:hypothetical protein [Bacteroidales bacterium]
MRRIFQIGYKIVAGLIAFVLLALLGLIIINQILFYKPANREKLFETGVNRLTGIEKDNLGLITWNIGYAGLGKEIDFFYEGGKTVRPDPGTAKMYIAGILNTLERFDTVDFVLLQEIDVFSKRSYFANQVEQVSRSLKNYNTTFAKNYDVWFVPVPVYAPMGRVEAGMAVLGRYHSTEAFRYSFPPDEAWPKKLFLLSRCYTLSRYKTGDKELVIINIHNSAYDEEGTAKRVQMEMLKKRMLDEYNKGNYVIAGGDWNMNPPGFNPVQVVTGDVVKIIATVIEKDFFPEGWKWAYDSTIPTNRDVSTSYHKGKTKTTILDYFLVSPNIDMIEVKSIQTEFRFSDHQPVYLKIGL